MFKRKIIKSLLLLFVVFYGVLFVMTFLSPQSIEKHAGSFIAQEVSKRTHERIDSIGSHEIFNSKIMVLAKKKMEREQEKLNTIKILLHQKVDEKLAEIMIEKNKVDAEHQKDYKKFFHGVLSDVKLSFEKRVKQLKSFMQQSYKVVMQKLLDDFKIFLGSNFISLVILLLLLHFKPQYERILLWLGGFMMVSTMVCSYFYVFNQNWFLTLIFNDFVGYSYLIYLLALFSFFIDLEFNKARITEVILNGMGSFLGG